jgi:hypothetical protein
MDDPWIIHGLSMANPWMIHGLSMDDPWIIHGLSMDHPWIIHGLGAPPPPAICDVFDFSKYGLQVAAETFTRGSCRLELR